MAPQDSGIENHICQMQYTPIFLLLVRWKKWLPKKSKQLIIIENCHHRLFLFIFLQLMCEETSSNGRYVNHIRLLIMDNRMVRDSCVQFTKQMV